MATILGERFPIVELDNKLTVVNYGSNHTYSFVGGKVLDKCTDKICHETQLMSKHTGDAQVLVDNGGNRLTINIPDDKIEHWRDHVLQNHPQLEDCKMWLDVFINYQISDRIQDDLIMIAEMDIIDIILVPRTLLEAWTREAVMQREIANSTGNGGITEFVDTWEYALLKLRTIKIADRVTKLVYPDQFCSSNELRHFLDGHLGVVRHPLANEEGLVL